MLDPSEVLGGESSIFTSLVGSVGWDGISWTFINILIDLLVEICRSK